MQTVVEKKKNFRIVRRGEVKNESSPLDCPLCTCILIDEIDEISISRSKCCFDCEVEVADPNRERWLKGWRPDEITISEIKRKRFSSPHSRKHI